MKLLLTFSIPFKKVPYLALIRQLLIAYTKSNRFISEHTENMGNYCDVIIEMSSNYANVQI